MTALCSLNVGQLLFFLRHPLSDCAWRYYLPKTFSALSLAYYFHATALFFTHCAGVGKCIPCYWMDRDFIKRDPLNWDTVQASIGSQSPFIRPREYLAASISDFSLIWTRTRWFSVNTHYPDIPINIWTAISDTSTDAWYLIDVPGLVRCMLTIPAYENDYTVWIATRRWAIKTVSPHAAGEEKSV